MKQCRAALILIAVMSLVFCPACAESFDVSGYTYEELQQIQQKIGVRLEELDRQYAIENADRQIVFEEAEQTIFQRQTLKAEPKVIRITENAARDTKFNWTSSAPEIASVRKGIVTGVAPGDAVITATAADSEFVFGSFTVHVLIPVEKITVWGPDTQMWLGGNGEEAVLALGCSVEPEDAYYQGVTWSSSDEAVAAVDENGTVRGLTPGTAVITATSTEPRSEDRPVVSAACSVTVRQAVTGLKLNAEELAMYVGERAVLEAAAEPENADDPSVYFRSSNPDVAEVDPEGTVTATGCGECEISCEAADGSGVTAVCRITVTKRVEGLAVRQKEIRIAVGGTYEVETIITPEDATNQELRWSSSNVFVARVADGKIEGISQGECVVTCTTTDGSNLSEQITVIIPTFSVDRTEYTVTEKTGIQIPVHANRDGIQVAMTATEGCFRAELAQSGVIRIVPLSAGTGTVTLSNPEAPNDDVILHITIENSAVYNQESYPPFEYARTMASPEAYAGKPISTRGKVLQINNVRDGEAVFMIGTGGEEFTDQVLLVRCDRALMPAELAQGEMLTLYGSFYTETIYSDALAAETQIPAMLAEKIVKDE